MSPTTWTRRPEIAVLGMPNPIGLSRIFGVGRNYSNNPAGEKKIDDDIVLFTKDPYLLSGIETPLAYPPGTSRLRYEVELVVAIGRSGAAATTKEAEGFIFGYGVGIDFTKYDVQDAAKRAGRPWDSGKSFPGCAPCSHIVPAAAFKPGGNRIWLEQNGKPAQSGFLDQLIWTIPELICIVSSRFTLKAGDLIFTGTPEGVGMVEPGDRLSGGVDGLASFSFHVV